MGTSATTTARARSWLTRHSSSQVWDLRTEQGIIDAFAKIWGTDELITSFDGASVFLPKRTDVKDGGKCT